MLQMAIYVITALKTTFTNFKEQGLYKTQGDNTSVITKHLDAVEVILNGVDSLM